MILVNFLNWWYLNILNLCNILMILNKWIIQWFSFDVATRALFFKQNKLKLHILNNQLLIFSLLAISTVLSGILTILVPFAANQGLAILILVRVLNGMAQVTIYVLGWHSQLSLLVGFLKVTVKVKGLYRRVFTQVNFNSGLRFKKL